MGQKAAGGKGSSKSSPMNKGAAARIQSASAKNTSSKSNQSNFDRRAQSAADKRSSK
jgi:hypothetical protein